ncbi:kinase-like domain-containing protein [Mycena sanguinolenta]|nr:kinase-like domain-containing protein [Mycena sanguinolenta]
MNGHGSDDFPGSFAHQRAPSRGIPNAGEGSRSRPPRGCHPDIRNPRAASGSSASGLRRIFPDYLTRNASPAGSSASGLRRIFPDYLTRNASPAVSESGYSTARTSSRLSTFGWAESAPASEDESSLPNTDHEPSVPSFKLELTPPASHEYEFGREIDFWDCDHPIQPVSVEIDRWQTLEGGNATTYQGKLLVSNGQPIHVAVKVIRVDPDVDALKYHERLNREIYIWHKLKHRNILPLIGMYNIGHDFPALISPFYNFGHIGRYLQSYPSADRHKLVHDCASGLKYLHDNGIVHGDLKPENILIDKDRVACICDFGISRILDVKGFTTSNRAGTILYMAPELSIVSGEYTTGEQSTPRTTFSSDMWAFGLVALGILTTFPLKTASRLSGQRLFVAPSRVVLENLLRPTREQYHLEFDNLKISAEMWIGLEMCWNAHPESRPNITTIMDSCLVKGRGDVVVYPRQSGH